MKFLKAIFGSSVPVDILKFALIEDLGCSNKTIIEHLKALVDLGILGERMEKT